MTSRLNVLKRAAGIAQAMGAPVEPMVYEQTLPNDVDVPQAFFQFPIERGPYVAFDGFFRSDTNGETFIGQQIYMWSGQRPITWIHDDFQAKTIALPGCVIFPNCRGAAGAGSIYNLDGWPAPMFVKSGDTVTVRGLVNINRAYTLALAGFHTSLPAWRAIASAMGEVRFWVIGDEEAVNARGADEIAVPEPVDVHYAYNVTRDATFPTSDRRRVTIENKRLATADLVAGVGAPMLGIPVDSSPGTVIGPRPLRVDATIHEQWESYAGPEGVYPARIAFVGVYKNVDL